MDLLPLVRDERQRSIGLELDPILTEERTKALNYYKGVMPDVPALENRSKAISMDVADTIETIMPDLLEIFVGGDDVATFIPQSEADQAQAQQETDYLHKVFFQDNQGFMILNAFFKDALLEKTGVVKWWWENAPEVEGETFDGKTPLELAFAAMNGQVEDIAFDGEPWEPGQPLPENAEQPLWSFSTKSEGPDGRIRIRSIPPEDFSVARDTVFLRDSTYCSWRSRPRAQQLKADGHDPDIVDRLPTHSLEENERIKRARDTAGENTYSIGGDGANRDLRTVEVVEHFIRVLGSSGQLELWRVFTGADETILIDQEKLDDLQIAAITPFIVTHRFFGQSIADKLLEIQRIKTALLRGQLDTIYFALNQRHYVNTECMDDFTMSDLLDNRPGVPVRGKGPNGITPLQSASSNVPYLEALEYASTMAEQRTGVVRNAQGLNPDTLHDTATGALQLMGMAQRRVRFIARIFAETGVKDMFLGIHATIRKHSTKLVEALLKQKFVQVDPTQWAERNDMNIEIGVGSGGAQQKLVALKGVLQLQGEMAKLPGAQLVKPENAYRAAIDAGRAAGLKSPEEYFTDPETAPPMPPPPPNPDLLRIQADQQSSQAKTQIEQAKIVADIQRQQAERQQELELAQMKDQREQQSIQAELQRELARLQYEAEIKKAELTLRAQEQADRADFERQKLLADTQVRLAEAKIKSGTAIDVAEIGAGVKRDGFATDLAVQMSESADVHVLAHGERAHDADMAVLSHTLSEQAKATEPKPDADESDEVSE